MLLFAGPGDNGGLTQSGDDRLVPRPSRRDGGSPGRFARDFQRDAEVVSGEVGLDAVDGRRIRLSVEPGRECRADRLASQHAG